MNNIVVVESPAKARTINNYLGKEYYVLASYGHICDLPPKKGSVNPEHDFHMIWQTDQRSEKQIKIIAKAVKGAKQLILATDPDREGEAISWHICNELDARKVLTGVKVQRVAFNAITKDAVMTAIANPRSLNQDLINAYRARRALDYLVGFTLSPLLWRKLPGARSAGRVQSVALRLVCERNSEIEKFVAKEYWSIKAIFRTKENDTFSALLTNLNGNSIKRFDIKSEDEANAAMAIVEKGMFLIDSVEKRLVKRNPSKPFTTSTLQQEASNKLGFRTTRTMQVAQSLYDGVNIGGETTGLITYIRTDGIHISAEGITQIRQTISCEYGEYYLPKTPIIYTSKAKNAQEAHEAIRPTDIARTPNMLCAYLNHDQWKLYSLIWKRAVASQMASTELSQTTIDVRDKNKLIILQATSSFITFDGFLKLYRENCETNKETNQIDSESNKSLPNLNNGDIVTQQNVIPTQHFTQPPTHYSEASLVKKMEDLGIGRPSTYANILQVLHDREYVRLDRRRFMPEDRGRLVTTFLSSFFKHYVEYSFTADLENQLDNISDGQLDWRQVLREFWKTFKCLVDDINKLSISEVLEKLDDALADYFFPNGNNEHQTRKCQNCLDGTLSLRLSKFGAFIGCSNYPGCKFTRQLSERRIASKAIDDEKEYNTLPRILGNDPETGKKVSINNGPYGVYLQLDQSKERSKDKPKRTPLPKQIALADIDLDTALAFLSLPRLICEHPETKEIIQAGIGRFGPYLKHGEHYFKLPSDHTVLTIGINQAVQLISENVSKINIKRLLGYHPNDGKPVIIQTGRFGLYAQHGSLRANLSKKEEIDKITLEKVIDLLNSKTKNIQKGDCKKIPTKISNHNLNTKKKKNKNIS
ncbi:DNA topoisomerase I [Candidatus Endolissoclinum faulkneri L2]|uniref:DNA topoisomerase 1 n=1 Tax=Candidatus Endolissoclinum faulkneri L2 TaxID=1193729 RepID=K7ZDL5_9PROT|nr:type I DNA topoisomerase [Candidatus Endolissoclinum faulkneri]AFX99631.1 DNA topoisomerase I [Candidatus Endolissoclinum faulkneri L2]